MLPSPAIKQFDEDTRLVPIDVDRYHTLIAQGVFRSGEPNELLDGILVRKNRSAAGDDSMTVGLDHALVVMRLCELGPRLRRLGCHLRPGQPVTLPPFDEPDPDAAIVTGTVDDYADRHPHAADITCVIEVADASLRRDRTIKQRIYARSGIPTYMIVNLPDRIIDVMTDPLRGKGRYGQVVTLSAGDRLDLPAPRGRKLRVAVRRLLP